MLVIGAPGWKTVAVSKSNILVAGFGRIVTDMNVIKLHLLISGTYM